MQSPQSFKLTNPTPKDWGNDRMPVLELGGPFKVNEATKRSKPSIPSTNYSCRPTLLNSPLHLSHEENIRDIGQKQRFEAKADADAEVSYRWDVPFGVQEVKWRASDREAEPGYRTLFEGQEVERRASDRKVEPGCRRGGLFGVQEVEGRTSDCEAKPEYRTLFGGQEVEGRTSDREAEPRGLFGF